jgi:hypothetical protein
LPQRPYLSISVFEQVLDSRGQLGVEFDHELCPLGPGILQYVVGQVHHGKLLLQVAGPPKLRAPGFHNLFRILEGDENDLGKGGEGGYSRARERSFLSNHTSGDTKWQV